MHVQVGEFGEQLAGQGELLRRAGRGETRGDGVVQTALAVPALDQLAAVGVAGLGGVGEELRGVAVHQHFAGDHPQIALLAGLEEGVHRLLVHRAEHQRGGGAVAQQLAEKQLGLLAGHVAEAALVGEGVGFQPIQQLRAVGADDADLRVVDMGIDEPGVISASGYSTTSVPAARVGSSSAAWPMRATPAVLDDQQAVLEVFMGLLDAHFCAGRRGSGAGRHGRLWCSAW